MKTMNSIFKSASVALGATVALSGAAIAEDTSVLSQIDQYSDSSSVAQVNSVFQLRDVAPSDWAFDALRNLVEKYNCIAGYPDGTFRGNRPLSRYEFAAGLNACLQQIERIITGVETGDVSTADLNRLRALVQEFDAELATLGARVDDIEGRVEFLEDNQFSTTTKLKGEVLFNLANVFGDDFADGDTDNDDLDSNVTFDNRVRLNFDTSFTGKDRLRTRLQAGNMTGLDDVTGTETARLGFEADGGNNVEVAKIHYQFPLGDKFTGHVGTVGLDVDDIFAINNPYFESSGGGALSRFARRNPITLRSPANGGVGFNYELSDKITFSAAYLADDPQTPTGENGLFNGNYGAGAQLNFAPSKDIGLSFTYNNTYGDSNNLSGSTGSSAAKRPFGGSPTSSNDFGIEGSWKVASKLNLAGFVGYSAANDENTGADADIWTWSVNAALLDVGGKGNVLGFIFGMPPKATNIDSGTNSVAEDTDTSYLAEVQYRYKLSKNITITPGAYVIFNPNHNDANDTIVVGAVRTRFKF